LPDTFGQIAAGDEKIKEDKDMESAGRVFRDKGKRQSKRKGVRERGGALKVCHASDVRELEEWEGSADSRTARTDLANLLSL